MFPASAGSKHISGVIEGWPRRLDLRSRCIRENDAVSGEWGSKNIGLIRGRIIWWPKAKGKTNVVENKGDMNKFSLGGAIWQGIER